jgi:hypothetical protein
MDVEFEIAELREAIGRRPPTAVPYIDGREALAVIDELLKRIPSSPVTVGTMDPVPGSEPEGGGFGKPWVPQPGVTFLVEGAYVRSLVDITTGPKGLVGVDVQGKWNHGAKDTLSILVHPEVAEQWGEWMMKGAAGAREDEAVYRQGAT